LATNSTGFIVIKNSGSSASRSRASRHRAQLLARLEQLLRALEHVLGEDRFLVAGARLLGDARRAARDRVEVGEREFELDHFDVALRIDRAGDVDDVAVLEATHDVQDRVALLDRAEELVAQAFTLLAPLTRPAMSTTLSEAGMMRSVAMNLLISASRSSGTSTTPMLGSIVQNG